MDIEKLMLPIAEFTEYGEVCFAHLSENGERKEPLREHTELCQKYWKEIVKRFCGTYADENYYYVCNVAESRYTDR